MSARQKDKANPSYDYKKEAESFSSRGMLVSHFTVCGQVQH